MNKKKCTDTLLEKLMSISSTGEWDWVSSFCLAITCLIGASLIVGSCIYIVLCQNHNLSDEHIRLIIYCFFMTIVLLFLIPIIEKFFAFKLYEEIGKQETVRQNTVLQLYTIAIEQLSAKEMSKEDIQQLLTTLKDCLNDLDPNNTELAKAVLTIRDTNKDLKEDISKQVASINTGLNEVKEIVKTLKK